MTLNSTSGSPAVVVATNNDWGGQATLTTAFAQVGAFAYASASSKDAALAQTALNPGNYTVDVRDANNGVGSVIVEIYDSTPSFNFLTTTPRLVNVSVLKKYRGQSHCGLCRRRHRRAHPLDPRGRTDARCRAVQHPRRDERSAAHVVCGTNRGRDERQLGLAGGHDRGAGERG